MKTYLFRIEVELDEDGRWAAVCPALPGCATWGHRCDEAVRNIREAVEAYVDDLVRSGEPLPPNVHVLDEPAVSVTL